MFRRLESQRVRVGGALPSDGLNADQRHIVTMPQKSSAIQLNSQMLRRIVQSSERMAASAMAAVQKNASRKSLVSVCREIQKRTTVVFGGYRRTNKPPTLACRRFLEFKHLIYGEVAMTNMVRSFCSLPFLGDGLEGCAVVWWQRLVPGYD
jgi:hypothetical protein